MCVCVWHEVIWLDRYHTGHRGDLSLNWMSTAAYAVPLLTQWAISLLVDCTHFGGEGDG